MPWFVPPLTPTEIDLYKYPGGFPNKHRVGRWPHPNTLRVDCRYFMVNAEVVAACAFNRFFRVDTGGSSDEATFPMFLQYGNIQLEAISPGHIQGTSDVNSLGWTGRIDIQSYDSLPLAGAPGVNWKFKLEHPASGEWGELGAEFEQGVKEWTYDIDVSRLGGFWDTFEKSALFPFIVLHARDWAMSDCYLFPREDPAPTQFADFNNIDATLRFDAFTLNNDQQVKLEFDLYLRDENDLIVLGRSNSGTRWVKMRHDFFSWRLTGFNFDTNIPLNTWGTFRAEWDWGFGLSEWHVFWNDVQIGTKTAGFVNGLLFNQFGERGNIIEGNFKMKNLTLEDGGPVTPRLLLSTELQANACDIGVSSLKGTTTNMVLPSCP